MERPTLFAVPNVSEGRDAATIEQVSRSFAAEGARLLDVHSDADHHRSVFTLAGRQEALADALLSGARAAVERVDIVARAQAPPAGQHPHVGAVDVVPVVYLEPQARGAACAEALVVAERLAQELEVPVFLYGELTADDTQSETTRAEIRRGGVLALRDRLAAGEAAPTFGPRGLHPTAGATLVAARPPLVAFNVQLAPAAGMEEARRVAALIREGGALGLPGLRAIAVQLQGGVAQVSTNVERPFELPLAAVVAAVAAHAPVASAELVGLAPRAALEGFPEEVELVGFDSGRHVIENALGS
jgi:glutamate formiminotransferase/glutamate formiminotransferase/formiminotetrahydrofolate cyclodeaminase